MYCKHCGKEIADDSAFCSHCGKSLGQTKTQAKPKPAAAVYQAPVEAKPKKPVYKRIGFWLLMIPIILFILLILIGTFASSGEPEQASVTEPASREDFVPVETRPLDPTGDLGDFAVEIHDYEIVSDFDGNPAILISYTFTNKSDDNATAMVSIATYAYQNGIQLDSAFIANSNVYSADDKMKEIKPGASITVKDAYELLNETAPVSFEAVESFSFSDQRLGKNFVLAEDGVTELVQAPVGEQIYTISDCDFSIISHEIVKDYDGNNAVMFTIGFTNYSDKAANYLGTISLSAFQNGVELETAFLGTDVERDSGATMRNVKPGAGLAVYPAYVLTSNTAPVEIQFTEFMSFSDEVIETVVNIAE